MPPTAGRVIAGRYFLEESVGHGGMGVVWRAHDRLLDRKVAVKEVMLPATVDESELTDLYQRTRREARTAARLNHRGIVAVYDVAEDDERLWIVMELVSSPSLDEILSSQGPLAAPRVARIGRQLLSALTAAHAAGVLHRDVKPSNVLIVDGSESDDGDERAVLTDFGIARFADDTGLTTAGVVLGSPGFIAPERLRGAAAAPASDLWSLGATLYAAVEGHGPYDGDSESSALSANAFEAAPPARSAGQLAPLIAALMRPEPSARPSASVAARMFSEILVPARTEHAPTLISTAMWPDQDPVIAGPVVPPGDDQQGNDRRGDDRRLSAPTTADSLPLPEPAQAFAQLPLRERTEPGPGRQRRRFTLIARIVVVITALVVGGYLFWQGELSKNRPPSSTGQPVTPATSAITLPPVPVKATTTPAASSTAASSVSTALPSVSTAPGIVQAIDTTDATTPAGYARENFSAAQLGTTAGFSIARPPGWRSAQSGQQVTLQGPNGSSVEIDLTKHAKSDMMAEAEYLRVTRRSDFPGYQRIYGPPKQPPKQFFQPENIQQTLGALWEFDWVTSGKVAMREDVLLFTLDQQSYTIYAAGPAGKDDNTWNSESLGTVSTILGTFQPIPAS